MHEEDEEEIKEATITKNDRNGDAYCLLFFVSVVVCVSLVQRWGTSDLFKDFVNRRLFAVEETHVRRQLQHGQRGPHGIAHAHFHGNRPRDNSRGAPLSMGQMTQSNISSMISRDITTTTAGGYTPTATASSGDSSSRPLVVGSMTTTPWRLESINTDLGTTINTLLSFQRIDRLYLNIPWKYGLRSESVTNVSIPDKLLEMVNASTGRLRVQRTLDYGPSTKLLPLLLLRDDELPPDTIIITFDDDRIYTQDAVDVLYREAMEKPSMVIAIAAWGVGILSSNGRRGRPGGPNFHSHIPHSRHGVQYVKAGLVDIICGFFGVAYRKRFFTQPFSSDIFNYTAHPSFLQHCAWVDDIWFSGHLERLNIPRHVVGKVPNTKAEPSGLSNTKALSLDKGESVKQNFDNVECADAMRKVYGVWEKGARRNIRRR